MAFGVGLRGGKGVHQTGSWVKNISVSVISRAQTLRTQQALHIQDKKEASVARSSEPGGVQKKVWPERHRVQDHGGPAQHCGTSCYSVGKCSRQSSDTT